MAPVTIETEAFGRRSRASSRCRSRTAGSPGRRTSSSPGSPTTSASAVAPARRSAPRSSPPIAPRWPAGRPSRERSTRRPPRSVGSVGTPTAAQAAELASRGFPPGTLTGTSGLELAWNERLAGKPGGQLLAVSAEEQSEVGGGRIIASSEPLAGKPVRTTIDPALQESAVSALGSLYGGVAVLDARKGSVLALSGLAYSAPQPPGSTFKVITATGALDAGIVKLADEFPVETSNSEIGREIPNAHDEPCGGTFAVSFALSCNTVFAPLGAELGGRRLVETAEKFGFNSTPRLFDSAATEVDRSAGEHDPGGAVRERRDRRVGDRPGSGAGDAAADGERRADDRQPRRAAADPDRAHARSCAPIPTRSRSTSAQTAATMRDLMIGVVTEGTGIAAALPGIQVAGKTGTAELGPAALEPGEELEPDEEPPQETDAWFIAFAPAADPKLAVAVMVVNSEGDGGTVAAPIAREVLATGLGVG